MKNKKYFNLRYLIALAFLMLFFAPSAYAGDYDCAVDYKGSDGLNPFTYDGCCFPQGTDSEPYQGISCRPEGQYLRKAGNNPTTCVDPQGILVLATDTRTAMRKSFNCFTGAVSSQCRVGYCKSGGACQERTGVACPTNLNRIEICPGGCGGCQQGYVYCEASQPVGLSDETAPTAGSPPCELRKDGSTFSANNNKTCAEMGRPVINPCTGECGSCPEGLTPSGRSYFLCITYGERFLEILNDGFAFIGGKSLTLGGVQMDNAYPYGSLGDKPQTDDPKEAGYYGNIFVEVDLADHLNWSSPSIPAPIKGLIASEGVTFCDDNQECPGSQICTAGICNDPLGTAGTSCSNISNCQLGLECYDTDDDGDTECAVPPEEVGLTDCRDEAKDYCSTTIGAGYECVNGFCYDQTNGLGSSCASNQECEFGLICASDVCVVDATPPALAFLGITNTKYTSAIQGYDGANAICDNATGVDGFDGDGSHVCAVNEIMALYSRSDNTLPDPGTGVRGFVNGGPPGYTAFANDCGGWTKTDSTYLARFWNFDKTSVYGEQGWIIECNHGELSDGLELGFTCCK